MPLCEVAVFTIKNQGLARCLINRFKSKKITDPSIFKTAVMPGVFNHQVLGKKSLCRLGQSESPSLNWFNLKLMMSVPLYFYFQISTKLS